MVTQFSDYVLGNLLMIVIGLGSSAMAQPTDVLNPIDSQVEIIDNSLMELNIKQLGEVLKVQYSLKTPASSPRSYYDVYIAYSSASVDNQLWFVQANGEFTQTPVPYYTKITNTEDVVLDFSIPVDLNLIGEHFFYAALLKAGQDVSTLKPADWEWERLSSTSVFLTR